MMLFKEMREPEAPAVELRPECPLEAADMEWRIRATVALRRLALTRHVFGTADAQREINDAPDMRKRGTDAILAIIAKAREEEWITEIDAAAGVRLSLWHSRLYKG